MLFLALGGSSPHPIRIAFRIYECITQQKRKGWVAVTDTVGLEVPTLCYPCPHKALKIIRDFSKADSRTRRLKTS